MSKPELKQSSYLKAEKPLVLVVDDDGIIRSLTRDSLEDAGFAVEEAADGRQAVAAFKSLRPDIILLDVVMPNMDGFETCRAIRSHPSGRYLPILIMTALDDIDSIDRAYDEGASDFITKPINWNALGHHVRYMLRSSRAMGNLERLVDERTADLTRTNLLLEKEEESLRSLKKAVETLQIGVTITDVKGKITYTNSAEAEMHGYDIEELIGKNVSLFAPAKLRKSLKPDDIKNVKSWVRETVNVRKDGSVFPAYLRSDVVVDDDGQVVGVVTACEDITERKRAADDARRHQQQLIHADKMKSLGVLVAGVAHEINNPNNFISLNSQTLSDIFERLMPLVEEQCSDRDGYLIGFMTYDKVSQTIKELLSGITDGSNRIKHTVEKLKGFARHEAPGYLSKVDINCVVESAVRIVDSMISKSTENFVIDYGKNMPQVLGNRQELDQVVINLLTNACQSLSGRGKGIRVSTVHDPESHSVCIKVRDEGIGIAEDELPKITEPFFTTKRDSGGTGLGLSVSFNIVSNHRGKLEFKSEPGSGTEAAVTLFTSPEYMMERRSDGR